MISAKKWEDQYQFTKDRVVLTDKQFFIPGVRTFGHHTRHSAMESLSWHYHENSFEFSIPAKGTFTFSTPEEDYRYSGGDVFISYPNEIHGTNQIPVSLGDLYWFQLDISDVNHFLFLKPDSARTLIEALNNISLHVVKTDMKKTLPLIKEAFHYGQSPGTAQLASSYLQLFLHLIIVYAQKTPSLISADIQAALDYMHHNITSKITLEQLASIAQLSCSQFKQKFKKQLGIAPRQYINQQKIEYSKNLLKDGKSVTEIAMLLDFSTSGYFSTVFKKYTLYSPSEYLKKRQNT